MRKVSFIKMLNLCLIQINKNNKKLIKGDFSQWNKTWSIHQKTRLSPAPTEALCFFKQKLASKNIRWWKIWPVAQWMERFEVRVWPHWGVSRVCDCVCVNYVCVAAFLGFVPKVMQRRLSWTALLLQLTDGCSASLLTDLGESPPDGSFHILQHDLITWFTFYQFMVSDQHMRICNESYEC